MKRNIQLILLVLITWLLQTLFGAFVPNSYVTPNMLLILSCSMGFLLGTRTGMWTGFLAGIFYDLMFGNIFGLTALVFMYAGVLNGKLYRLFFEDDIRVPVLSAGLFDFIYNIVLFITEYIPDHSVRFGQCLKTIILPDVFATILAAIPLYLIYRWLSRRMLADQLEEEQSPWLR